MITIIPGDTWDFDDVVFEFDATLTEDRQDSYKATQYAIESGAEVSDYVVQQPKLYTISGILTAWNAETDEEVATRLEDLHERLVKFADTGQPVGVVNGTWYMDAIIVQVSAKREGQDALEVEIQLQSYQRATYDHTNIPPELLAESVRPGAVPEAAGGAASTEKADEEGYDASAKTGVAALVDGENPADVAASAADTLIGD